MKRGLCVLAAIVFGSCFRLVAQVSWNVGSGSWDNGDNWAPQGVPAAPGADEVYITNGGSVFITNAVPAVDRVWVGSNGSFNAVSVIGSGYISNHYTWIGLRTGTGNVALIDGGTWISDQFFILGHSCVDNRLTITNGGSLVATKALIGGFTGGERNLGLITGSGSTLSLGGELIVGNYSVSGRLDIVSGARVESSSGSVGYAPGAGTFGAGWSVDNVVVVAGTGSLWTNTGGLTVGSDGSIGNLLEVRDEGRFVTYAGTVGSASSSTGNVLRVTGSGVSAEVMSDLWVGAAGFDNRAEILGGAHMLVGGSLSVGGKGESNSLEITGGSQVRCVGEGAIGVATNGGSHHAIAGGAGSVWATEGKLTVGADNAGNSLVVTNGGRIVARDVIIGGRQFSIGWPFPPIRDPSRNALLVTGGGSELQTATMLVGKYGNGNRCEVADGGKVITGDMQMGTTGVPSFVTPSRGSSVLISDDGSELSVSGTYGLRYGTNTQQGGRVVVGNLQVAASDGHYALNGGTLVVSNSATFSNGVAFVVGDGIREARYAGVGGSVSTFAQGLVVTNHGVLSAAGQIVGNVVVAGRVCATEVCSIVGTYTQAATGELRVPICGYESSGRLDVTGHAALAGSLALVTDTYAPRAGETFVILGAGSLDGRFDVAQLPPPWPGLGWDLRYDDPPGQVALTVTGRVALATYDTWADYHAVDGNESDCPGGVGVPYLTRYAMGLKSSGSVTPATGGLAPGMGQLQIRFSRNTDATDVDYFVDATSHLADGGSWSCILSNLHGAGWTGPADVVESYVAGGLARVIVTDIPASTPARFLRLRIRRP